MGTERWSRLRPDRGDGVREALPVPRSPSMDAREEHLAATRIDVCALPVCPRGRTRQAAPAPRETAVRCGALGATGGGDLVARMLEERSPPDGGSSAPPGAGSATRDDHGGHRTSSESIPP